MGEINNPYEVQCILFDGRIVKYQNQGTGEPLRDKTVKVRLVCLEEERPPIEVDVDFESGERLLRIRRKLNKIPVADGALPHGFKPGLNVINVIGIERPGEGTTYMYVRPDGSVRMSTSDVGE